MNADELGPCSNAPAYKYKYILFYSDISYTSLLDYPQSRTLSAATDWLAAPTWDSLSDSWLAVSSTEWRWLAGSLLQLRRLAGGREGADFHQYSRLVEGEYLAAYIRPSYGTG